VGDLPTKRGDKMATEKRFRNPKYSTIKKEKERGFKKNKNFYEIVNDDGLVPIDFIKQLVIQYDLCAIKNYYLCGRQLLREGSISSLKDFILDTCKMNFSATSVLT
jgi:hypothetical protein